MPEYCRFYKEGGSYFFTVVTHKRQRFLLDEPIGKALRESIQDTHMQRPFKVDAWVLLPDHLHCIWTLPPDDDDFSICWLLIKGGVSKRCKQYENPALLSQSRMARGESSLWQRRFWEHYLGNEADFVKHMDDVHFNPVKHGYAERPKDWPYSTFKRCVVLGLYEEDWGVGGGGRTRGGFWGSRWLNSRAACAVRERTLQVLLSWPPNGLRYWRWGGRGFCLGAEKTRSQKNIEKCGRIPSVQSTLC